MQQALLDGSERSIATLSSDELLDQLKATKNAERLRGTLKMVAVAFCYVITVASQVMSRAEFTAAEFVNGDIEQNVQFRGHHFTVLRRTKPL